MDVRSASDLVSTIFHEIPINTTTAYMESTLVDSAVISNLTLVDNLTEISFLTSTGNTVKYLVSATNSHLLADVSYIKLGCLPLG